MAGNNSKGGGVRIAPARVDDFLQSIRSQIAEVDAKCRLADEIGEDIRSDYLGEMKQKEPETYLDPYITIRTKVKALEEAGIVPDGTESKDISIRGTYGGLLRPDEVTDQVRAETMQAITPRDGDVTVDAGDFNRYLDSVKADYGGFRDRAYAKIAAGIEAGLMEPDQASRLAGIKEPANQIAENVKRVQAVPELMDMGRKEVAETMPSIRGETKETAQEMAKDAAVQADQAAKAGKQQNAAPERAKYQYINDVDAKDIQQKKGPNGPYYAAQVSIPKGSIPEHPEADHVILKIQSLSQVRSKGSGKPQIGDKADGVVDLRFYADKDIPAVVPDANGKYARIEGIRGRNADPAPDGKATIDINALHRKDNQDKAKQAEASVNAEKATEPEGLTQDESFVKAIRQERFALAISQGLASKSSSPEHAQVPDSRIQSYENTDMGQLKGAAPYAMMALAIDKGIIDAKTAAEINDKAVPRDPKETPWEAEHEDENRMVQLRNDILCSRMNPDLMDQAKAAYEHAGSVDKDRAVPQPDPAKPEGEQISPTKVDAYIKGVVDSIRISRQYDPINPTGGTGPKAMMGMYQLHELAESGMASTDRLASALAESYVNQSARRFVDITNPVAEATRIAKEDIQVINRDMIGPDAAQEAAKARKDATTPDRGEETIGSRLLESYVDRIQQTMGDSKKRSTELTTVVVAEGTQFYPENSRMINRPNETTAESYALLADAVNVDLMTRERAAEIIMATHGVEFGDYPDARVTEKDIDLETGSITVPPAKADGTIEIYTMDHARAEFEQRYEAAMADPELMAKAQEIRRQALPGWHSGEQLQHEHVMDMDPEPPKDEKPLVPRELTEDNTQRNLRVEAQSRSTRRLPDIDVTEPDGPDGPELSM